MFAAKPWLLNHCSRARLRALVGVALYTCVLSTAIAAPPIKLSGTMVSGGDAVNMAINSTSTHVVFRADRETDGVVELYSVPIGGGVIQKLSGTMVTGGNVQSFNISPDGLTVAFVADRVTNEQHELWMAPINGSVPTPVALSGPVVAGVNPAYQWAPNSGRVVFATQKTVGVTELYSIGTAMGSPLVTLSGTLVSGGDVATIFQISPDSTRVVFRADKDTDGVDELYSAPIATANATTKLSGPLVVGGNVNFGFLISPDSTRVVFLADKETNGVEELYSAPIATANAALKISGPLVPSGSALSGFLISPDGVNVVFRAIKDSTLSELYSAPIATADATTKVSGALVMPGGVVFPGFQISADNARVVFMAVAEVAGVTELYSAPIATANATTKISGTLVSGGDVVTGFQISANSARVVFIADKDSDGVDELYSAPIATADSATKISGPLVPGGILHSFRISADGTRVVFHASKDTTAASELYSTPIATANAAVKISGTMVSGGNVFPGFQISADNTRVAFMADKDINEVTEVYSVGSGGGGAALDIDGDGLVTPMIDGLMLMRWQLGVRGAALFGGVTFPVGATRTSVVPIEDHLRRLSETPMGW